MLDPKGIYRCVLNLVSNALDASKDFEGSTITISTDGSNSDIAELRISDQGHGINKETRDSIFKPFFSTKKSEGTGLGLSVTQKLITEHGGTIQVESEPEKGATFIIKLPRK